MATTVNYSKICEKCNGKYYSVLGYRKGFFGVHSVLGHCDCDFGIIKPKQVIHRADKMEPEIIY
jgi:hypothetical protein